MRREVIVLMRSSGRFEFTFTPEHGSWLNLIENFFSKFDRSVLRYIRVGSKHELGASIIACIEDVNRYPFVHSSSTIGPTSSPRLLDMIRTTKTLT